MGFLTNDEAPVIWRGPMLHGVITQFFRDVRWPELDYLIVDMPPGTGDVALSLSQSVPVSGAVVVTTPQRVSLADTRRAVKMYEKLNAPVLGLIENMSHFVCPGCGREADLFGRGGGEGLATELGMPFLGRVPLYEPVRSGGDNGMPDRDRRARVGAGPGAVRRRRARRGADLDRQLLAHDSADPGALMDIAYTKTTLANGLDVILHEDHTLPIVAVNVWYHVGSKDERPGLTGFAHLFEHLMFEGSAHHDHGYFPPLQDAGAAVNGSTNADRTNYWEVVPTGALELALFLESDRMGFLLPALTEKKFTTQREVVINERRQNYENRPYGLAGIATTAALYPADHPYHWPTIGYTPDLRQATLDDVRDFFARHYHPGNASIALAGDIDPASALALVERYFGDLPTGPPVPRVAVPEGGLSGETRIVLEDRVDRPRLYLAWRTPALFEEGDAALDVAADVIASGKTSRLYRTLVHERRLALDVSARAAVARARGLLPARRHRRARAARSTDIEAVINEALGELAATGPTDAELERALAQAEANFVYRLQTVGGFSGKSDQLNAYNVYRGNPGSFDADLARYTRLTVADVRDAVPPAGDQPARRAQRGAARAAAIRRSPARSRRWRRERAAPHAGGRRVARHPLPADRQAHARRRLARLDGRAPRPAGGVPERPLSDRQRRRSASIASASPR